MAKRMKGRKGRGAAAVPGEAEAILRRLVEDSHLRDAVGKLLSAVGAEDAAPPPESKKQQKQKQKRKFGVGKMLLVAGLATGGALAASEGLRTKVLDLLFGAEEEFEYTPPPPASTDGEAETTPPLSAV